MFWKQTIEEIHNWQSTFDRIMENEIEFITELQKEARNNASIRANHENLINALMESNETNKKCIEELKKHEEAIADVIQSDRKDINAIINIIKQQNKKDK